MALEESVGAKRAREGGDGVPAVWLAAVLVVLAAVVPYLSTLHNYFVQDDFGVVALLSSKPATYFPRWFTSNWMDHIWGYTPDEIRPFPAVSYQLTSLWGATTPTAHHALNIAFHAVNGLLVLALGLAAAGLSLPGATVAALVFVALPVQSESVAWITGRVDSMPTLAYLASFLCWVRWRADEGQRGRYGWALAWLFLALFTKQNTITLGPALVAFDWLMGRRPSGWNPRGVWAWARPYLPFAALTLAFLALRFVLFGAVVREQSLREGTGAFFLTTVSLHLRHMVFGLETAAPWTSGLGLAALIGVVAVVAAAWWRTGVRRGRTGRQFVYWGVVWMALGLLPIAVAGYSSPRHVYLAAVGFAVALGVAFDVVAALRPAALGRALASIGAVALLTLYGTQLRAEVRDWNRRAALSQQAVRDLETTVRAAVPGTLVLAGVPQSSWEWAVPFVLRPPYVADDLTGRVTLVTPRFLHCCRHEWDSYTRDALGRWLAKGADAPLVALFWDERTGALSQTTGEEEPTLRTMMTVLRSTDTDVAMDEALRHLLEQVVAPHRRRP